MSAKLIIALAAIGIAVIVLSTVLIGLFVVDSIAVYERNNPMPYVPIAPYPTGLPSLANTRVVPIIPQPISPNPDPSKPYVLTSSLTAADDRNTVPYTLYISGWINNTGGGTVYNGFLHVIAYNQEGKAIDNNYPFQMTGHVTLGLSFRFDYSGSPIDNCSITPLYLNPPLPLNTTSP